MYNENCRHCGTKEAAHEIRLEFEIGLDHCLSDEERAKRVALRFAGEVIPCDAFVSEIDHASGCPAVTTSTEKAG